MLPIEHMEKRHAGGLGLVVRNLALSPHGQLETRNTEEVGRVS